MSRLEEKKVGRSRFLNALYEATDGQRDNLVSMWGLGEQVGIPREEVSSVVDYLVGKGFVEHVAIGGTIGITHDGIVQVEKELSEPEAPTRHFSPVTNIINVHSMTNSQIQQGNHDSSQSLTVTQNDLATLRDFVVKFAEAVRASDLPDSTRAEVEAAITTLQVHLQSPKLKHGIIAESLRSVHAILEGAAGSVLAGVWLPKLLPLLANFSG